MLIFFVICVSNFRIRLKHTYTILIVWCFNDEKWRILYLNLCYTYMDNCFCVREFNSSYIYILYRFDGVLLTAASLNVGHAAKIWFQIKYNIVFREAYYFCWIMYGHILVPILDRQRTHFYTRQKLFDKNTTIPVSIRNSRKVFNFSTFLYNHTDSPLYKRKPEL